MRRAVAAAGVARDPGTGTPSGGAGSPKGRGFPLWSALASIAVFGALVAVQTLLLGPGLPRDGATAHLDRLAGELGAPATAPPGREGAPRALGAPAAGRAARAAEAGPRGPVGDAGARGVDEDLAEGIYKALHWRSGDVGDPTDSEVERLHDLVGSEGIFALRAGVRGSTSGIAAEAAAAAVAKAPPPAIAQAATKAEVSCFKRFECRDYDAPFVEASAAFVLNEDFNMLEELRKKKFKVGMMDGWELEYLHRDYTWKVTPTASYNLLENKWNMWVATKNLGLPVMGLVYAATEPQYRHPAVLHFDRERLKAAVSSLPLKDFVLKPMACKESIGVKVFSQAKWEREGWTVERLAREVDKYFTPKFKERCWDEFQHQKRQQFDMTTSRTAPGGVMVLERYSLSDVEHCQMSGEVTACHHGEDRCHNPDCIPMELRAYVVWGRVYSAVCYGSPACGGKKFPYVLSPTQGLRKWTSHTRQYLRADRGSGKYRALLRRQHVTDCAMAVYLPRIVELSERVARSLGFDFMRADWFVGGRQGLRLNELSGFPYSTTGGHSRSILEIMIAAYREHRFSTRPNTHFLRPAGCELTGNATLPLVCSFRGRPGQKA